MASLSPPYIQFLRQQQIIRYCRVAPISIWVFDYILTLDEEVNLLNRKGWRVTHVLYIFTRFFSLLGALCGAYNALATTRTQATCVALYRVAEIVLFLVMLSAEGLLLIRTIALWGHAKGVRHTLIVIYGIVGIVMFVCAVVSASLKFSAICESSSVATTSATALSRVTLGMFSSAAFFELVVLTLTIIHGYTWHRSGYPIKSKVMSAVTQGNFVYALSIFLTSIANISFFALPLHDGWNGILTNFQGILHGVVAPRILFSLRNSLNDREDDMTISMSRLRFAPVPNNTAQEAGISD